MQKKIWSVLLCLVLTISLLAGCGGNETQDNSQNHKPSESQQSSETPKSSETQTSESEPSESETPPPEPSESETPPPEPSESETPPPEPSESQEPEKPKYTYVDLKKTMYATVAVNVRDLPSTEGARLGQLAKDEAVKVIGQCNETKWYRIEFNGSVGYVSDGYLTDTKPVEPEPTLEPDNTDDSKLEYVEIKSPTLPNTDGLVTSQEIVNVIITSGMSEFEKVFAIHNWLTFNIDYDHSYTNYYAAETLRDRKGVCQGYAYAFREMCTLVGIDTTIVGGTGTASDGSTESHAWNQVKIGGTWYNVDVTWDDPSNGPSKDPSDHSGNRYDYFLVSNDTLYKDHQASEIVEGSTINTCSLDYSRKDILQKAVDTGWHGDVAFASTKEELEAAVLKYMKGDRDGFWLWYYDTSMTESNWQSIIDAQLQKVSYPARVASYYPLKDAVIKVWVEITPVSEWNKLPVVTNVNEFKALLDQNGDAGVTTYTIRYESTSGAPEVSGSKYGLSYIYVTYNNGQSMIMTITIK